MKFLSWLYKAYVPNNPHVVPVAVLFGLIFSLVISFIGMITGTKLTWAIFIYLGLLLFAGLIFVVVATINFLKKVYDEYKMYDLAEKQRIVDILKR